MAIASNLGFPRVGARRELKKALEDYWSGNGHESGLLAVGKALRQQHWTLQKQSGLEHIPSNDFSLYDSVLDTAAMVGAVPSRYGADAGKVDLRTYFAMARGLQENSAPGTSSRPADVPAMEMTKWLDTNYHYIVPEFEHGQRFQVSSLKPVEEFLEAKALGIQTRPLLLGPVSLLLLGKSKDPNLRPLSLLETLLPVYADILERLENAGAEWVQMDEPCLVLELPAETRKAFTSAYARLSGSTKLRLLVATYFEGLRDNLSTALALPVAALHVDLVRAPDQLEPLLQNTPSHLMLSLGVIDGRNIWKTDLQRALTLAEQAVNKLGSDRVLIAPSCSLLHSPVDLDLEVHLRGDLREWLAFAKQKVEEVVLIARAINQGSADVREAFAANEQAMARRRESPLVHDQAVKVRAAQVTPEMLRRTSEYPVRREAQREKLKLPLFPTTTIGSFPQTAEIRTARSQYKTGKRERKDYNAFLRAETEMAIRDEVRDLEQAGIGVIQIDEPAIREGLPLRKADWQSYLGWAVAAFRTASCGAADATQIHTHMCYSEFNDIIEAVGEMDADVILIETSRSQMELLSAFARYRYPNDIGPGVYDIHSPRIPKKQEIEGLLRKALRFLSVEQLWVNPDCGLKTRKWEEVRPALATMVEAARDLRATALSLHCG